MSVVEILAGETLDTFWVRGKRSLFLTGRAYFLQVFTLLTVHPDGWFDIIFGIGR